MLAKEIKIRRLRKQKKKLEDKLLKVMTCRESGDAVHYHLGTVYPEVKEYFEKEGFNVEMIKQPTGIVKIFAWLSKNKPVFCFTLKEIELTEEEWQKKEDNEDTGEVGAKDKHGDSEKGEVEGGDVGNVEDFDDGDFDDRDENDGVVGLLD